jgi:hypothetical protein
MFPGAVVTNYYKLLLTTTENYCLIVLEARSLKSCRVMVQAGTLKKDLFFWLLGTVFLDL